MDSSSEAVTQNSPKHPWKTKTTHRQIITTFTFIIITYYYYTYYKYTCISIFCMVNHTCLYRQNPMK
jgi:hypothetical protein